MREPHRHYSNQATSRLSPVAITTRRLSSQVSNRLLPPASSLLSAQKQDVLPEYLCWLINLPQSQRSLERSGSAIQAISKASLMDMKIPLPPLATQQKLIALQALWDEEDELITRLQTNREQMLQGIYQHLIKD